MSLVVALGYGVGLGKLPRRPFLVGLLLAFAGTLVVLRLTLASGAPIAFGVIGVAINVVNTIMLTLVWTIAATALDARQAKRLFPLITSAAIAGGFVGTLTAGPLTALIGPENLVLVVAGLIVLGAAFAARIGTRATRSARAQTGRPAATSALAQLRAGFDDVRRSPLLRLVAIAYVLFSILMFSVQFPYQTAIADAFGDDDAALATFVGLVQAGVTAISFVVSIALANRIFARFGVVAAALILPVVYVLGFGTWLVHVHARDGGRRVVQPAGRPAQHLERGMECPVHGRPERAATAGPGVHGRRSRSAGGKPVGRPAAGRRRDRRREPDPGVRPWARHSADLYVGRGARPASLRRRAGADPAGGPRRTGPRRRSEGWPQWAATRRWRPSSVRPSATRRLPSAAWPPTSLGAWATRPPPRPSSRCLPMKTRRSARPRCGRWASSGRSPASALAARLAEDPAAAVRAELAVALAGAGEAARADELLDGLLTAADPDDRAIGLAASARAGGPRLAERATHGLADGSSRVRAAAAEAFAPALHAEGTDEPAAIALLVAALDDEALAVRRAAAQTLAGHDLAAAAMVEVLSSGSERAQEAAVRGLEGTGTEMIEPVRAWAHERIARVTRLRVHAAALQPADPSDDRRAGPGQHRVPVRTHRPARATDRGPAAHRDRDARCPRGDRPAAAEPARARPRRSGAGDRGPRRAR